MFKRSRSKTPSHQTPSPTTGASTTGTNEIDLHMHTFYSDGRASPRELLTGAKHKGLRTVAITDHETARASREGAGPARDLGLSLIPAIELTAAWPGYVGHGGGPDIDILGYFIDPHHELLLEHEAQARERLSARAQTVCDHLQRSGYALRLDDVLATNAHHPGFVALRDTLVRKGLVNDARQGARLLESALLESVWKNKPTSPTIAKSIELVHALDGVAVLAHPSIVRRASDLELLNERGLAELVEMGLDGLEVLHYRLDVPQRRHFELLAKMFQLPVTGGSDEHGGPVFRRLGSEPVTPDMLNALRRAAEGKSAQPDSFAH